jgi:hypothetical protein
MRTAVVTFVYNESINLPIWLRYYSANFGSENLFVVDRGSDDGSTGNLGEVNVVRIPRDEFDDHQKTGFINRLCEALLFFYDTVIYNDCDEIVVPNLSMYSNLRDYLDRRDFEYVSCIGLNVLHIISKENPLDLKQPILAQRRYALFTSAQSKPSVIRVPINWAPGFHCSGRPPNFDPNLYLFHNKTMDYSCAMLRQGINRGSVVSQRSAGQGMGAHWRYSSEQFVREGFLDPQNVLMRDGPQPFDFTQEIARINAEASEAGGQYSVPMNIQKLVEIPEHLKTAF